MTPEVLPEKDVHETALVPSIASDHELSTIIANAERGIEAFKKIKAIALKVTNSQDWVDENGKPYLQGSGAEKVGRLFGVNWTIDQNVKLDTYPDGHFMYTYFGVFSWRGAMIEAIGTRSSRDPFFSRAKGQDIPPTEIDHGDLKKSAYTNCIANGITRILGIRNLTWDEVRSGGIDQEKAGKVEYKGTSSNAEGDITTIGFGKHKGKTLAEVPTDYLQWLLKDMVDKKQKPLLQEAIKTELENRRSGGIKDAEKPVPSPLDTLDAALVKAKTQDEAKAAWTGWVATAGLTDEQIGEGGARYNARHKELREAGV